MRAPRISARRRPRGGPLTVHSPPSRHPSSTGARPRLAARPPRPGTVDGHADPTPLPDPGPRAGPERRRRRADGRASLPRASGRCAGRPRGPGSRRGVAPAAAAAGACGPSTHPTPLRRRPSRGRPRRVGRSARAARRSPAGSPSPAPFAGRGVVVVDHGPTRTTYEPVAAERPRGAGGPPRRAARHARARPDPTASRAPACTGGGAAATPTSTPCSWSAAARSGCSPCGGATRSPAAPIPVPTLPFARW